MRTRRRPLQRTLAVGTALTLGLGGALIASPAFADEADGTSFEAQLEVLKDAGTVVAYGYNAQGEDVVVAVEGVDSDKVTALEASNPTAVVTYVDAKLESFATTDVVGGAGYLVDSTSGLFACSVGFSAWTPDGDPALLSAGHCADGLTVTGMGLSLPSEDPAAGGAGGVPAGNGILGDFGFYQYGGPGNTAGANGNADSIDISVIDVTNSGLTLLPEVTDWTTAASNDLSGSTVNVTSVGEPTVGQTVTKSGRTTGSSSATVDIVNGWANVSGHWVQGFGANLGSDHGDSGGAIIQGNTAVGVVSGGDASTGFTWGAGLVNALGYTGGYTVMLHVDAPAVTSPASGAEVEPGTPITGTAPAGTTVVVTPAGGSAFEVTVAADGTWTFPAPADLGAYSFSVIAQNGFNTSSSVNHSVTVVPAPITAPTITSPADGASIANEVTTINGAGIPGATVTVTGDVTGTATVAADGTWSIDADLSYGSYSISVTQASGGQTSPAATASFSVVLPAPAIVSPANGAEFAHDAAPATISGTGVDGATVSISLNDKTVGTAEVVDGAWSISIADLPTTGVNTVTASQTVGSTTSVVTTSTFTLAAAPTPPGGGGGSGDTGAGDSGDGGLATTGGSDVTPYVAVSALLLMIGAGLFMVSRRRKSTVSLDA